MSDEPDLAGAADPDDPEVALREARQSFVAGFPSRCHSIELLVDAVASPGREGPVASLQQVVHRLTGLAGMVGFPTVSARAADLEALLVAGTGALPKAAAQTAVAAIREAFARDLTEPAPDWASAPTADSRPAKILLAEDDQTQRRVVEGWLRWAGYSAVSVGAGNEVVDAARRERPSLVLLDVEMPGLNGHVVCRHLKADPELSRLPVIFMTTRSSRVDRLAALTLGADDYLTKPFDPEELGLRIKRLLARRGSPAPAAAGPPASARELDFEAFVIGGKEELKRGPAALALVRVPPDHRSAVVSAILGEIRRRDLLGHYDDGHVVLLLPGLSAPNACKRLGEVIGQLQAGGTKGASAGVAASVAGETKSLEELLAEADEALAESRYLGEPAAVKSDRPRGAPGAAPRTAVLADDDPEVTRIVDAQLRAAGYRTLLAFDGQQALDTVRTHAPDVLVLDLMMPKLSGFDVLDRVREMPEPRPRVIVLSGRGREEDVTRAFEAGADDYLTKPFSPQELLARLARLLK